MKYAPYSYSRWGTYKGCPRKFEIAYRQKIARPPPGPAAERGTRIHNSAEDYLNDVGPLDTEVNEYWHPFFADLKTRGAKAEDKFCFDEDWCQVDWDDSTGLIRGMWDIHLAGDELDVWELKTGKVYDDHVHQRDLYALAALRMYPQYDNVTVTGIYLDKKSRQGKSYYVDEVDDIERIWGERIARIEADEVFIPAPSYGCRWCAYSRHNGSDKCEF